MSGARIARMLAEELALLTRTNGTYQYQRAQETDSRSGNVAGGTKYYRARVCRLIGATLIGDRSDDGNLIAIRPRGLRHPQRLERDPMMPATPRPVPRSNRSTRSCF